MKTYAPSCTNCFAVARPMPLLPPVMSAIFPSSLCMASPSGKALVPGSISGVSLSVRQSVPSQNTRILGYMTNVMIEVSTFRATCRPRPGAIPTWHAAGGHERREAGGAGAGGRAERSDGDGNFRQVSIYRHGGWRARPNMSMRARTDVRRRPSHATAPCGPPSRRWPASSSHAVRR